MQVKSITHPDLVAGLLFLATGISCAYLATDYSLGNAMRMGPGYFPLLLGLALGLLGVVLSLRGLRFRAGSGEENSRLLDDLSWRPAVFVAVGVVAFALLAQHLGLLLATLALTLLSGLARPGVRLPELLVLSLALALFGVAVFAYGLGLPLPVLPV